MRGYKLVPALLLGLVVTACRTTADDRDASETATSSPPAALEVLPSTADECPVEDVVCPQEDNPSYCTASAYLGRALPDGLVVRAWGPSLCAGRVALAKEACARGFKPSALDLVQCVPDASGGNCPPASVACGEEEEPSLCTAGSYGDQKLSSELAVQGWGLNACRARQALAAEACARNLNPVALGDVRCSVDPQGGECPPFEQVCRDARRPSKCEAKSMIDGRPLAEPLLTEAGSSCEANQKLLRLACSRGIKPSDIEDVVCTFGK